MHRSADENLLAVGDTAGGVKIFNYPCLTKDVSGVPAHHKVSQNKYFELRLFFIPTLICPSLFPPHPTQSVAAKHRGHIKDVAKVRFSCDGKYCISVGKHDRAVIVWKLLPDESIPPAKMLGT